jgi:hypothetical protein
LTIDGQSQSAPLELKLDPRVQVSQADLEGQFGLLMEIREQLNRVYAAANQIEDVRAQTEGLKRRLPDDDASRAVATSADGLAAKLVSAREPLVNLKISANEDSLAYRPAVDGQLAFLSIIVGSGCDCGPTEAARQRFEELKKQTDDAIAKWNELQKNDVAAFQKLAADRGMQPVAIPAPNSRVSSGENEP